MLFHNTTFPKQFQHTIVIRGRFGNDAVHTPGPTNIQLEGVLQRGPSAQFTGVPHPQIIFAAVCLFQLDSVRLPEKHC